MPSIGKFIKHQSQFNDKFQVSLQVHTAFGVQEAPPTTLFFVSYRRGDHKGASMKLHSSSPHTIAFDQTCNFNFPCTLYYYDIAKKDYEEKELTVMFNEETSAEPPEFKTLGKANIDLAKYAKEVPINSSKSFPLTEVLGKKRKGEALRLQVTLTLTCLLIQETPKEEAATPESACSITLPASAPLPIPTSQSNNSINLINNNNNNNNHHDHSTPNYPSTPPSSGNLQATPMSSTRAFLTSTSPIRNNSAPDRSGSASSIGGLSSFSAPSRTKTDDDSISSYSSRNNSPPSSPSSSPSTSPRATTPISSLSNSLSTSLEGDTLDRLSNSGITRRSRSGSGNTEKEKVPFPCLPSSNSYSNLSGTGGKPFLSTPAKMHLLEKQSSDSNLLNTGDIAKRLANRHPDLGKSREGTPATPKIDRIDIRSSMDSLSSSPSRPFPAVRRHLDFKTEKVRSYTDIKVPIRALKQKDDEKFLTEEIINMQPTYCNKIPVLAYILFRSLLQWRSFHPNNSLFLDSVFQAFNNQSNIDKTDVPAIEVILYRISSAATLLHILHKELQILSDNVSSVLNDFEKRLKQSLNTYYELYYSKVKEELDGPILSILGKVKTEGNKVDEITNIFEKHLNLVRSTIFFDELQHQIIYQIFYYFSARVLNSLLQRTTSCQCQVGLGLKMAVLHIENWAALQNPARETSENNNNGTGVVQLQCDAVCGWIHSVCRRAMSAARQAADVLVVTKSTLVEPKIREEVCPSLSAQQLLVLLEGYVPDEFDPEPIHPGVLKSISEMPVETKPNNYTTQNNILSSPLVPYIYPFPLDTHFQQFLPLDNITIPSFITDQPGFSFLRDVCSSSNQHW